MREEVQLPESIPAAAARCAGAAKEGITATAHSRFRPGSIWHALTIDRARALPRLATLIALTSVYYLAGKLGLSLAIVHPSSSAVWAPTGIAIAALLVLGFRFWPAIFAGAFVVNITTQGTLATSLGIAAGNTLEALIGAFLVNRFANGRNAFDRANDAFRFALIALASAAVSATVGVTSLSIGGFGRWADYGPTWLTWWLGDTGGALVVAPLLILWSSGARRAVSRARVVEAAALLLGVIGVGLLVFGWTFPSGFKGHPLAFLCMPVLIWAAFRFDQRIASAAVFVLSVIAVVGALRDAGPAEQWELNASLVLLQVFMAVASVTTLALAAMVAGQRRVEQAIRTTSTELRAAMTDLEAFSHSISHDLRSPVGAVINYAALIEEDFGGRLGEEGLRMLGRVRSSAESAVGLLDQLVQVSSLAHDKEERRQIDMDLLASEVHREIVVSGADGLDIHFVLRNLPPAWGSAALLRCVFRNLFSNAAKYTRGRPERRVEVGGWTGESENTYFVEDNGIGFSPAQRDSLFEPTLQPDGTRKFEGTGLGLAIVAKIIRQHRGRIWAESDGSSGARFTFTLPRRASGL